MSDEEENKRSKSLVYDTTTNEAREVETPEIDAMWDLLTKRQRAILQCIGIMAWMENGRPGTEEMSEALQVSIAALGVTEDEYMPLVDIHNDIVTEMLKREGEHGAS